MDCIDGRHAGSWRPSHGDPDLSRAAMRQGSTRRPRPPHGFTLIELLVVIAILSLLVSILMPSLNRAKFLAKNAICLSNEHQIALAMVTYTGDFRDVLIFADESPYKGVYNGNRQAPRILADAGLLPISDDRGGVWRCPLDDKDWKPRFLSYYYYYEGGPGAGSGPTENPLDEFGCSYSNNAVFRHWSGRTPWSYWGAGGGWNPKFYSNAAHPTDTIWFYDTCWHWPANYSDPYTLLYTWGTLLWHRDYDPYPYYGLYRHKPESYSPYGNVAFMDGHVMNGLALLDTICDDNYDYDEALALDWWSFTGD